MDLCVSVAIHAFLGNKKDSSSDDQDGTNHIEDRGTDTTGAGKDGARVVIDGDLLIGASVNSVVYCGRKLPIIGIIGC